MATGGPLAWGLCYNKELSPDSSYCDEYYKLTYPCAPGAEYYGRGALPIYWYEPLCSHLRGTAILQILSTILSQRLQIASKGVRVFSDLKIFVFKSLMN